MHIIGSNSDVRLVKVSSHDVMWLLNTPASTMEGRVHNLSHNRSRITRNGTNYTDRYRNLDLASSRNDKNLIVGSAFDS